MLVLILILRSISEISSCFFGPRPWHIEIRHRVKKISAINLFGFETLNLKIRRLKLWKPTVLITLTLARTQLLRARRWWGTRVPTRGAKSLYHIYIYIYIYIKTSLSIPISHYYCYCCHKYYHYCYYYYYYYYY